MMPLIGKENVLLFPGTGPSNNPHEQRDCSKEDEPSREVHHAISISVSIAHKIGLQKR